MVLSNLVRTLAKTKIKALKSMTEKWDSFSVETVGEVKAFIEIFDCYVIAIKNGKKVLSVRDREEIEDCLYIIGEFKALLGRNEECIENEERIRNNKLLVGK